MTLWHIVFSRLRNILTYLQSNSPPSIVTVNDYKCVLTEVGLVHCVGQLVPEPQNDFDSVLGSVMLSQNGDIVKWLQQ